MKKYEESPWGEVRFRKSMRDWKPVEGGAFFWEWVWATLVVHLQLALLVDRDVTLKWKVHRLSTLVNPSRSKFIICLHLVSYSFGWDIYLLRAKCSACSIYTLVIGILVSCVPVLISFWALKELQHLCVVHCLGHPWPILKWILYFENTQNKWHGYISLLFHTFRLTNTETADKRISRVGQSSCGRAWAIFGSNFGPILEAFWRFWPIFWKQFWGDNSDQAQMWRKASATNVFGSWSQICPFKWQKYISVRVTNISISLSPLQSYASQYLPYIYLSLWLPLMQSRADIRQISLRKVKTNWEEITFIQELFQNLNLSSVRDV